MAPELESEIPSYAGAPGVAAEPNDEAARALSFSGSINPPPSNWALVGSVAATQVAPARVETNQMTPFRYKPVGFLVTVSLYADAGPGISRTPRKAADTGRHSAVAVVGVGGTVVGLVAAVVSVVRSVVVG